MLTYQMQFNAKVEAINLDQRQIVVEYFDPHGGESIRLALGFKFDATEEDIRALIIDATPHTRFYDRNEELKFIQERNIDLQQLESIVGEHMKYNLPTYDNEVI